MLWLFVLLLVAHTARHNGEGAHDGVRRTVATVAWLARDLGTHGTIPHLDCVLNYHLKVLYVSRPRRRLCMPSPHRHIRVASPEEPETYCSAYTSLRARAR